MRFTDSATAFRRFPLYRVTGAIKQTKKGLKTMNFIDICKT